MRPSIFGAVAVAFAHLTLASPAPQATGTQVPPQPPTTTGPNGQPTPLPTQPGMVNNCERFSFVEKDNTCRGIARKNRVVESDLIKWNPTVGPDCKQIWAGYHVCVRTIGYKPTVEKSCYEASNTKTWGDNKPGAISAAAAWCATMTTNLISQGEKVRGCRNAPLGVNKFDFEIENPWGTGVNIVVTPDTCKHLLDIPINGCARGGQAETEGWIVRASVTAGRC